MSHCYGYGKAMELPGGTLYILEQDTGGRSTKNAANLKIRCLRLRLRIRPDHSGIDQLRACR